MSPEMVGVVAFIALFILLFMGMHVGFAMAFVALVGIIVVNGLPSAILMFQTSPFSSVATYTMAAIPLFILMGVFADQSGLVSDLYNTAYSWLAGFPGGLAIATIAGCTGFAACTGSSTASVAMFAVTALPEMEKRKYSPALSTGVIASGTTLGILIPPSLAFIVYGLFGGVSIGQLFMAGILPGLLIAGVFISVIVIWVKIDPSAGPRGPRTTWREKFASVPRIWAAALLIILVLGGIWGGFFTATEAAGMGAFLTLVIGLLRRKLKFRGILDGLWDAMKTTAMICVIMIGALMLNYFLAVTKLPMLLATSVDSLSMPPIFVIITIMIIWLFLGCVMDTLGMILLTLPIFFPIVSDLGFNMVWFGVLMVIMIEAAEITPPIGINVFVMAGVAKDVPMYTIFKGITPFLVCQIVCLAIIIAFPQIALILPQAMISR